MGIRRLVGLLAALLLAPLALVMLTLSAAPASAAPTCLAQADKTACVSGTVGSRSDPVEGADVILLDEAGAEVETQTTEADGKFAFQLTEAGTYFVRLDNDTLPEGLEQVPPTNPDAARPRRLTEGRGPAGTHGHPRSHGPFGGLRSRR